MTLPPNAALLLVDLQRGFDDPSRFTTNRCISTTAPMAGNLAVDTWVVSDATAAFDRVGPEGVAHPAEQVHQLALCDLDREFATVVDTQPVIASLAADEPPHHKRQP